MSIPIEMDGDEQNIPVFIAHEDGSFKQHELDTRLSPDIDDRTKCGIAWSSLPDIVDANGDVWVDDKPWYSDHDRDDVTICLECAKAP